MLRKIITFVLFCMLLPASMSVPLANASPFQTTSPTSPNSSAKSSSSSSSSASSPKISVVVLNRDFTKYKKAKRKTPKDKDRMEIIYFYYFGSPWSAQIDGELRRWAASRPYEVVFRPVPAYFNQNPAGIFGARIHYALEALGQSETLSPLFIQAVQKGHVNLAKASSVFKWMENRGISEKDFQAALNSKQSKFLTTSIPFVLKEYEIQSTPTIVIDGQYIISATSDRSPERVLAITQFMADKLSKGGPRP